MLADLDRPAEEYFYEPWDREVVLRRLSAMQFVEIMKLVSAAGEDDVAAKVTTMAKVCSLGIVDPAGSAEQWANETCVDTLMHLGNRVLTTTVDQLADEAKKN